VRRFVPPFATSNGGALTPDRIPPLPCEPGCEPAVFVRQPATATFRAYVIAYLGSAYRRTRGGRQTLLSSDHRSDYGAASRNGHFDTFDTVAWFVDNQPGNAAQAVFRKATGPPGPVLSSYPNRSPPPISLITAMLCAIGEMTATRAAINSPALRHTATGFDMSLTAQGYLLQNLRHLDVAGGDAFRIRFREAVHP
jgi:hypothetical protein